eukprot:TRINITY_DN76054_c0_g1_i1.p1 TRINITY_DN76054_c0_g1~~TRINITY_DN76054_c0_g1_i1.p1  ORF type:complete len:379 (-),score=37.56 TRINITY_DN76054_c0_g1_i1:375-1511(-)
MRDGKARRGKGSGSRSSADEARAVATEKTLYDVLGLEQTASAAELHKAYRRRALETHPDKGGSDDAFHAVQKALATLKDGASREEYDRRLQAETARRTRKTVGSSPIRTRRRRRSSRGRNSQNEPDEDGRKSPASSQQDRTPLSWFGRMRRSFGLLGKVIGESWRQPWSDTSRHGTYVQESQKQTSASQDRQSESSAASSVKMKAGAKADAGKKPEYTSWLEYLGSMQAHPHLAQDAIRNFVSRVQGGLVLKASLKRGKGFYNTFLELSQDMLTLRVVKLSSSATCCEETRAREIPEHGELIPLTDVSHVHARPCNDLSLERADTCVSLEYSNGATDRVVALPTASCAQRNELLFGLVVVVEAAWSHAASSVCNLSKV